MGETNKQVRVDNWGIFFLSRLQVFFNKTDYCDLTLQFEGNAQLKVHRLVMNACTEYFQVLEQTCEVVDDVLFMPPDLQADVILPIVNFMYTGMLEFQMSIFEKLYKTAELMNIPVLLKVLDAQKQTKNASKGLVSKVQNPSLQGRKFQTKIEKVLPATLPGRKLPVWKRKSAPLPVAITPTTTFSQEVRKSSASEALASYDNAPKPTRFEWPEDDLNSFNSIIDTSFDTISYTSKPLLTQEEEFRASTSFDDVRDLPSNNKKVHKQDYAGAPVDFEDLKNYVKEQKIRSDMVEDEEDVDNDLESDPDYTPDNKVLKRKATAATSSSKKVRFNEKENKETKINVTTTKSIASKTEIDHSKIISEVLKKYPHLVKKNKNIRLKILAKNKNQTDSGTVQAIKTTSKVKVQVKSKVPTVVATTPIAQSAPKIIEKPNEDGPWTCDKCSTSGEHIEFVLYYLYRKHMTDVHHEKFDSRLCKYCGYKSGKHNLLMYHQYTKHGIQPPVAYTFPKCTQCPYIALNDMLLTKHKLKHTKYDLQCVECKIGFNNETALKHHIQITGHVGKPGKTNYDCQYCTRNFQTSPNLFSHIKRLHNEEARRDGIVSIDEEDEFEDEEMHIMKTAPQSTSTPLPESDNKVRILSNVKLATQENATSDTTELQNMQLEEGTGEISNVSRGMELVDIVVLDDNQQYILHPNNQQIVTQQTLTNNQEFMMPELSETHAFVQNQMNPVIATSEHNVIAQTMLSNSDIASTDELVMVLTDHDYNDGNNEILTNDNSNIVVLYSHPVEGQENQFITSQGNLMLNAETGILELRSGNGDAIVTQANTVESIEMIQREIESHSMGTDVKATVEDDIDDCTAPAPPSAVAVHQDEECAAIENEQQEQEGQEVVENRPVDEVATTESNAVVEGGDKTDGFAQSDAIQYEINQEQIPEEVEKPDQPEPMEVDEECTNETVEPIAVEPKEESAPKIDESEVVQQEDVKENIAKADSETPDKELPIEASEILKCHEIEENATKEAISEPEQNEDKLPVVEGEEEKYIPPVSSEEPPLYGENADTICFESESVPYVDEPMEVDGNTTSEIVKIKGNDEVKDEIIAEKQEEKEEVAESECVKEEDSVPLNESITSVNDSIEESYSTNNDNDKSDMDDKSVEIPIADSVVAVVVEGDVIDGSVPVGNNDEDEKTKMSKISILDDWEDTDSQQSEHSKSTTTVNKLMNEWDDD